MRTVLFLCTGNYYRSRFAEEIFNFSASAECPDWRAASGGIALHLGRTNAGPISRAAAEALVERGIATFDRASARAPRQVTATDLEQADHVVVLDRSEHLPLLREHFPEWLMSAPPERVEWWHVHDVGRTAPSDALPHIEREVLRLMRRLDHVSPSEAV